MWRGREAAPVYTLLVRKLPLSSMLPGSALLALLAGCPSQLVDQRARDRFDQGANPLVDILWVIDDTATMTEVQAQLGVDISSMLGPMVDLGADWHYMHRVRRRH